jgi:CheY-like chemotaxis protein
MPNIRLVEDNRFSRIATQHVLVKAGYSVACAVDGDQALTAAKSGLPDLTILDMLLPKLSGFEVLRSLKKNVDTADISGARADPAVAQK